MAATAVPLLRNRYLAVLIGLSIRVATDASDFAWGGHAMIGPLEIALEYFSESMKIMSDFEVPEYLLLARSFCICLGGGTDLLQPGQVTLTELTVELTQRFRHLRLLRTGRAHSRVHAIATYCACCQAKESSRMRRRRKHGSSSPIPPSGCHPRTHS